MFSIEWENPAYLRVRASGRLSWSDYDRFVPAFAAELARRGGRAPLLFDLRGWRGWTPGGFARDLFFNLSNRRSFLRIAVVGDHPWHKWLTYAAKPIFIAPMRYFDAAQEAEAVPHRFHITPMNSSHVSNSLLIRAWGLPRLETVSSQPSSSIWYPAGFAMSRLISSAASRAAKRSSLRSPGDARKTRTSFRLSCNLLSLGEFDDV